jgi:hypothetical protein
MADWNKNLNNYWLKQANRKENVSYEEKVNTAWKTCTDYFKNCQDDKDFDFSFFKELVKDYIKICLPEATEKNCEELSKLCFDLVKELS